MSKTLQQHTIHVTEFHYADISPVTRALKSVGSFEGKESLGLGRRSPAAWIEPQTGRKKYKTGWKDPQFERKKPHCMD